MVMIRQQTGRRHRRQNKFGKGVGANDCDDAYAFGRAKTYSRELLQLDLLVMQNHCGSTNRD